ncbi:2-phospho-L-lactate guanylyltransferase [Rathayibacter sp. YIM 133350]|uniref:2-phospho-L-lactate guanylyltransferase n=1 Tax=Rathayibacter sp. YIM 133350 TaxID=3131992 RepID=UPI00307D8AFD
MSGGWSVVVPVKGTLQAKSRLGAELSSAARAELGLAFGQDTVAAALACPAVDRVFVVTAASGDWPEGVTVVPEVEKRGLNAAIRLGIRAAEAEAAASDSGVAVLLGDLPALRPDELGTALTGAARLERAFVPDAEGTGTTLLTAVAGEALEPRFGEGSAAAHEALGHRRLEAGVSVRRDVDVPAALDEAVALGVGPRTAAALAGLAR